MSWWTQITGRDAHNRRNNANYAAHGGSPSDQYTAALDSERQGGGWQGAFNQTAGAAYNRALPQLREGLQMSREDAIRRGVSTGDYQTSREGDLTSAWGKDLADSFGGLAMQGYNENRNRYLDLLTGKMDRDQASKNANQQQWMDLLKTGAESAAFIFG